MKISIPHQPLLNRSNIRSVLSLFVLAFVLFSPLAFAQEPDPGGCGATGDKVEGFLNNLNGLLNLASILVVTIAIIFAGYQIAFAHKRIADVAPILIGGLLIGAAAQIANMIIGKPDGASC